MADTGFQGPGKGDQISHPMKRAAEAHQQLPETHQIATVVGALVNEEHQADFASNW